MSTLGNVRIGKKAPDFRCEAVCKGIIEEVSLKTYINPDKKSWLVILFIPAAFSFVCPAEVLAFQNCLEEFKDRNCDVIFVSVDTKHSLWHWQNVPRQYGGLGQIDITLLSDVNHKMSQDYGVLIEDEGVCLRGMFILDQEAVVQQVTLNNLTVGRSVLEALRLLEAFQAVAKHGVLCPIDWRPSNIAAGTISTISNTLTASYEDRLTNLQKEFGDIILTDLDAKHKRETGKKDPTRNDTLKSRQSSSTIASGSTAGDSASIRTSSTRVHTPDIPGVQPNGTKGSASSIQTGKNGSSTNETDTTPKAVPNDCLPHTRASINSLSSRWSFHSGKSSSAPNSTSITPMPTPAAPREAARSPLPHTTTRHARGTFPPPIPIPH
ncbi:hypothetical protein GRF29_28g2353527 [Pseudopithomyces chartarum]|uniref:Thioredoxin domain-containing protein n=1 Tax=Pseudopithomyces chartarum TaxID=1892770 RepID=A0AAN6M3H0_9PLEO|nr:hypothetical protein GRF29_28g2353527 [Pseudopithomyces chartarum]